MVDADPALEVVDESNVRGKPLDGAHEDGHGDSSRVIAIGRHLLRRAEDHEGVGDEADEDVKAVALDDETFSSDNDMLNERAGSQGTAIPRAPMQHEVDPPRFGKYRTLLHPKFSPAAAEPWRPFLQQCANALIDKFCASGCCDIVHDLASPVPAMLTMKLLGLPLADWEDRRNAVP